MISLMSVLWSQTLLEPGDYRKKMLEPCSFLLDNNYCGATTADTASSDDIALDFKVKV